MPNKGIDTRVIINPWDATQLSDEMSEQTNFSRELRVRNKSIDTRVMINASEAPDTFPTECASVDK